MLLLPPFVFWNQALDHEVIELQVFSVKMKIVEVVARYLWVAGA